MVKKIISWSSLHDKVSKFRFHDHWPERQIESFVFALRSSNIPTLWPVGTHPSGRYGVGGNRTNGKMSDHGSRASGDALVAKFLLITRAIPQESPKDLAITIDYNNSLSRYGRQ